jgi:hypothetical protein
MTSKPSPRPSATLVAFLTTLLAIPGWSADPPSTSPEAIQKRRMELFFRVPHVPLSELSQEVVQLATDSERCRIDQGTKACGLTAAPLRGGDLENVFNYYIKSPCEAMMDRQKFQIKRDSWDWNRQSKLRGKQQ